MNSPQTVSPLSNFENQIDALIECGNLFHQRGWSVGTSSNYSIVVNQEPVELVVTASGMDKGRLKKNDFVHLNSKGEATVVGQPKSSAETMLHVVLAKQPNVGSILHTHSIWGTLLSDHFFPEGGFEIAGYEMLKGLQGINTHESKVWVPIYENTQDIAHLAERVAAELSNPNSLMTHGFLIRNHGLYTWGGDVYSARRHIEVFEFLFEILGRKIGF
ncbi:MAG: methylthioribulose 1-phosphate dehydratase [Planctomycetota bacterium]